MQAVDEVDVGESGWAEEDGVSVCLADCCVGGGVVETEVGLDLDDSAFEPFAPVVVSDDFAEEIAGD